MATLFCYLISTLLMLYQHAPTSAGKLPCRNTCGPFPINYPIGVEDGCGSPFLRRIFTCSDSGEFHLRTPSGIYAVINVSYTDPHILIMDPFTWRCNGGAGVTNAAATVPFSLDTSTPLRLSTLNDYLFFNCSDKEVIMEPKPIFCRRFPEQCDSICDTGSYLCRNLPDCGGVAIGASCCAYFPDGSESLRMMLTHCSGYAGVYWRNVVAEFQEPEYGIRVDFDIPATATCTRCQNSGGRCGFDVATNEFLCFCGNKNTTTLCKDHGGFPHRQAVVVGTVTGVSVAGAFAGAAVWYLKKFKPGPAVSHGVQSNENRLF